MQSWEVSRFFLSKGAASLASRALVGSRASAVRDHVRDAPGVELGTFVRLKYGGRFPKWNLFVGKKNVNEVWCFF